LKNEVVGGEVDRADAVDLEITLAVAVDVAADDGVACRQSHKLRRDGASFRIVQKRVDLTNCDSAFEAMAVPI